MYWHVLILPQLLSSCVWSGSDPTSTAKFAEGNFANLVWVSTCRVPGKEAHA